MLATVQKGGVLPLPDNADIDDETRPPNSSHPDTAGYQLSREFSLAEGAEPETRGYSGAG